MLRILICVFWVMTVVSMWLPNILKNQFIKNNERKITKILTIVSALLSLYYAFF